jgi:toxin ParE1/3/4
MKTIIFHPLAKQELADAVAYYEAQRSGLGEEYLDEIEDTAALIAQYFEAGAIVRATIRRVILPKFPYSLLYRILPNNEIRILAVAHHKRRPNYWAGRR